MRKRRCRVHAASLYFSRTMAEARGTSVLNCPMLLRNMIEHSLRWGPSHNPTFASQTFFRAIAAQCVEWIERPSAFWLPVSRNKKIQEIMDSIQTNLRGADESSAAQACCMSVRSFRRHFSSSTGLTWREYIRRARLFYAADQLTGTADAIDEIAWQCNYGSPSAFAKAFVEFTGQTPAQYRRGRSSTSTLSS